MRGRGLVVLLLALPAGLLAAGATSAARTWGRSDVAAAHLVVAPQGPMFPNASLAPDRDSVGCATIRYAGSRPGGVHLYGVDRALPRSVELSIVRGVQPSPSTGCAGFVADAADWKGLGPGVIFRGTLADFPAERREAIEDPVAPWLDGSIHAYRFSVRLGAATPAAAAWTSTESFVWEVQDA